MTKKTTLFTMMVALSLTGLAFANEEMTNGPNAQSRAEVTGTSSKGAADVVSGSQSAANPSKKKGHRRVKRAKRSAGSTEGNPSRDGAGETGRQQAAPVGNNHP